METKNKRIPFITLLQAFAIILVVLGHASKIYLPWGGYHHIPEFHSDFFNILTRIIYTFHMPLFVFLSGYLCERTLFKNLKIFDFIKRRFKRLIIPFCTWGVFFSVPIWMYLQFPNANYKTFITGQVMGHLWFLPMLLEVTLIYLLLRLIPNKYNLLVLAGLITLQFWHFDKPFNFAINRIPEFLAYFYIGAKYFTIENHKIFSNKVFFNILTSVILVGFIFIEYLLYIKDFNGSLRLVLAGILGVIGFVFLFKIITEKFSPLASNKLIQFISLNLLNIYLIHEPILEIILKLINWGNLFQPIITTSILFFGTSFITFVLVILINWLKGFSKFFKMKNEKFILLRKKTDE